MLPYMDSVWSLLDDKRREGKRILFEGAQGALLDIDHGTYPFVTSSNTVAGAGRDRSRRRARRDRLRARHLQGLHDPGRRGAVPDRAGRTTIGRLLGERGREFGTVTGRPRRCGWFDAVLVRQTVRTSGIDGLALTKLDILDGLDGNQGVRRLPSGRAGDRLSAGGGARPGAGRADLRDRRGLAGPTARARSWADLPAQAIKYVRRIEELVLPGGATIDQPGAGGHHPGANPFEN